MFLLVSFESNANICIIKYNLHSFLNTYYFIMKCICRYYIYNICIIYIIYNIICSIQAYITLFIHYLILNNFEYCQYYYYV